ncbi:kinase-like domain-containing protein [Gamsiella multidivaricata]|uniref:kinase-like domain-containing protein n=1 Tax=Gamsiella multidivaricata TaxID=101098 RepID=UPI00221FF9F2|nr:kinase-like domain-containing protein [Gamsiella multidivaricata]KAG0367529.1 hypothetical protein BGZ54_003722 [Gamsiella multidivaricata]KAI7818401.1 kinase-like domain-containing protein [Gamsiella multidivaricata]
MGASCCKEEAIDFNSEIELSHFHLLRSVGKGAFGKVRVVQHKKSKEIYALKYINKAKCIRMRAVENIIQERRLLEEVEFSLICNLRYAFQDDENMFMVLDLMLGGDLRFHLERAGPMKEDVVRFYVAELALALDALHARRIIHRDLKPDNVLLDEHGHVHLTDFNIAVYFNPAKPLMSIAGSMAYMAPEVLLRMGYLESVDWWSLGVVMFELLFGRRPFRGKSNDLLTNSILYDPLPFPKNVETIVSAPCLDVLSRLCERDINKRLGCTSGGLDEIKSHPWFQGIEWGKLVSKEAIPPFEPDSKRANFDATHELEELLMEDNPLKAKKRAQTSPERELSAEVQMMEDKFTVYDFTKVKRSHSLSQPASGGKSLLRAGSAGNARERKNNASSTTPDGVLSTWNSSVRVENISSAPTKAYCPESPSDLVGQKRFNPDEDQISLISMSEASNININSAVQQVQIKEQEYQFPLAEVEKEALQQRDQQPQQDGDSVVSLPLNSMTIAGPLEQQSSRDHFASGVLSEYVDSPTPTSPSISSGYSTTSTSPTTYNNSPAAQKSRILGQSLYSTPDSGMSLSSMANVGSEAALLMDSASIPTPISMRTRALRDRQLSQNIKGGRAFELNAQAQQEKQQYQASVHARPLSTYTASNAGSLHESPLDS